MSKKTTYNPLGARVLIKQNTITEETTEGGIILTMDETNPHDREKQLTGVIISLGYKVDQELLLKKGLTVKFAKHSQVEIDSEEDLILVQDKDIQAIIIEEDVKENCLPKITKRMPMPIGVKPPKKEQS